MVPSHNTPGMRRTHEVQNWLIRLPREPGYQAGKWKALYDLRWR